MRNLKKSRNMSLIAGVLLLINIIIQLVTEIFTAVPILNSIACVCFFMDAYTKHKEIIQYNNEQS